MSNTTARLSVDEDRHPTASEEREPSAATVLQKKRRLLIYGINYAPEPIGVGRYTGELGAYLSEQEVEVDVVTAVPHYPGWSPRAGYRNRYKMEYVAGTRVTRCPLILRTKMHGIWRLLAPLSFAISSAPVVIWRILAFRPNTVLCVEPTLFAAPVPLLLARMIGARTVLHVQDLEIDAAFAVGHLASGRLQKVAAWFERKIISHFNVVVTISNAMEERLAKKGVQHERLTVVRNWVNLDKIFPLNGHSSFRRELSISENTFVVLYSGNIGPKQALSLVLDVARRIADLHEILFIIAGEGPEKRILMEKSGTLSNVRFLPLQPNEKLCELLNLADAHVLPQHAGSVDLLLPSKLGGMLASGKPCIVMADAGTELHNLLIGAAIMTRAGAPHDLAQAVRELYFGNIQLNREKQLELAKIFMADRNLSALLQIIFPKSQCPVRLTNGPSYGCSQISLK